MKGLLTKTVRRKKTRRTISFTPTNCQVVLLPSALVNPFSHGTTLQVLILVEGGSDQSYMREDIAYPLT